MAERVGLQPVKSVVTCRLESFINKGDLRFEDLGSSEAAIFKPQIRGAK
jgi:hypothetical protein